MKFLQILNSQSENEVAQTEPRNAEKVTESVQYIKSKLQKRSLVVLSLDLGCRVLFFRECSRYVVFGGIERVRNSFP